MVHRMTRFGRSLLVLGSQLMLMSCASQSVTFLLPLTETERQALGTIGIAAEVSRLETQYSRDPSIIDDGLQAMQDRLSDAGQGAIDGAKWVDYRSPINPRPVCRTPRSRLCFNESIASVLFTALFKGVLMTGGGIVGGVVGAIDRKTYSNPPLIDLPEEAVIQAVQQSIDAFGLPERLRDHVWEMAQTHQAYHFEQLSELPVDPANLHSESNNSAKGARYWALRDRGVQTLLKVRIPLIEFRGSDPEDSFRLFVYVETTLLRTDDQGCIRHRTWEFEGGSHRIDEWRENDAKLLIDELDRGLLLMAQHVTQAFFEQPSVFSFRGPRAITPTSESLACPG